MPSNSSTLRSLSHAMRVIQKHGPPLNFITIHYCYFILTSLFVAVILWGAATPFGSLAFIDAFFLAVSAMTLAGLNTVNLSTLNTFQQFLLFLLIMLGSAILVSAFVVYIRRMAFKKHFTSIDSRRPSKNMSEELKGRLADELVANDHESCNTIATRTNVEAGKAFEDTQRDESVDLVHTHCALSVSRNMERQFHFMSSKNANRFNHLSQANNLRFISSPIARRRRVLSFDGVGARNDLDNYPKRSLQYDYSSSANIHDNVQDPSDIETRPEELRHGRDKLGCNSQFSSLSEAERERLSRMERQALDMLQIVVLAYYILFQLFGCIALGAWVAINAPQIPAGNGLNPWWVGAFNAVSAFNNSGMSLLDANMVAFQWAYYMLITMGMLILVGNTCYPVVLRLVFWCLWKLTPSTATWSNTKDALRFILDHPRRVYTNLFPSKHTWFLLGTIFVLNAVDWVAFEILNIGNDYVESMPSNLRVIDGLFQAVAVRSGGFYVVPIANIAIAVQVLYVLMMYISVYPVTMTMRSSNVYEERSLGIYAADTSPAVGMDMTVKKSSSVSLPLRRYTIHGQYDIKPETHSRSYFVRQQIRSQLAHDLWWLSLAVFLIMIIEGSNFASDPVTYSVFNVVFEVVSAYGTVGISVGLPNEAYSFCGGWHTLSKLILCAVMLRGRHRGLPVAIDRAILLPSDHLTRAEEEDARLRAEKKTSLNLNPPMSCAVSRPSAANLPDENIV